MRAMTDSVGLAQVAALVGDPGRANMLDALLDRRALTASELAFTAGITPATASGHLAKLAEAGLILPARQGRHRYFRLASDDVARMLEAILVVAGRSEDERAPRRRVTPRISPALREARTCYDHLAGRIAVSLCDALVARGDVTIGEEAGEVTEAGRVRLAQIGIVEPSGSRRMFCRPCLDWSERRPHLAGTLGAALCRRCEELGWITRRPGSRVVSVTEPGRRGFAAHFDLDVAEVPAAAA
jgi:DNA-binding transcriptional ArsR family regulator